MSTTALRRTGLVWVLFALLLAQGAYAGDPTPRASLTVPQLIAFRDGLAVFKRTWPVAGRERNDDQCSDCHLLPTVGGSGSPYNANIHHGFTFEHASREVGMARWPQGFQDPPGENATLFQEVGESTPPNRLTNAVSRRVSRALHGMGSIERIPESAIRSREDPNDQDRDGVSGRFLGRFGSQAQWTTIEQVVRQALTDEVGLSPSSVVAGDVANLVAFARGLRDPVEVIPPGLAGTVQLGSRLFAQIGCEECHRQSFILSDGFTQIRPYSDFLVHDMGPCLDDGVALGQAKSYEWLTPPLWGMASRGTQILHDGRGARTVQAIQFHCGEAAASREAFNQLNADSKAAIRTFLTTLLVPE